MIGLPGSDGAGKPTLMRILCGIIQPTRGRVQIDGHDLADSSTRQAVKKALGYLPQDVEPYPNLTPLEFLDYVGVLKGLDNASTRRGQALDLIPRPEGHTSEPQYRGPRVCRLLLEKNNPEEIRAAARE